MKKSLTIHYTSHQIAYWATAAGVVSFASAYLMEKGFAPSHVGILLALGNLLSCVIQPLLADWADRKGGNILVTMSIALSALSMACFGCIQFLPLSQMLFGIMYLLGIFFYDAMNPLINAIHVRYTGQGYAINYGISRGIGSFAYSLSALGIGRVIASFGGDWMIWIVMALLLGNILILLCYPKINATQTTEKQQTSCSVAEFFKRYKWYCFSLLGVMMLAMFHAMTENYMIEIVKPLGGDSASVGVALFIATAVEMLVLLFFDPIRKRISDGWLLRIAGISFLVKSIALILAPSVETIYLTQLLQATSYTFLSPTQMYYANAKVSPSDMVKGQAFITAAYTLGCAIGNFLGGQLLQHFNLTIFLAAGVAMTLMGTLIFFLSVNKFDITKKQAA